VDPRRHAGAVVEDAVPVVGRGVVVERQRRAEVRVDSGRGSVGVGAVAPGVIVVDERRALGLRVVHVAGRAVAVRRVDHLETAATGGGVDLDLAEVDALTGAHVGDLGVVAQVARARRGVERRQCGDALVGVEDLAGQRVDEHRGSARRLAVGLHAVHDAHPRQLWRAVPSVDDQLRLRDVSDLGTVECVPCLRGHVSGSDSRRRGDVDRPGLGDGHTVDRAVGVLVHDEVAAEHRQTLVGPLISDVLRAVDTGDGVDHAVRVGGRALDRAQVIADVVIRDRRRTTLVRCRCRSCRCPNRRAYHA